MVKMMTKSRPGNGLILAGGIVLFTGLTVVLFRELDIPRYWIPVFVGAALMAAGIIVRGIGSVKKFNDEHDT